LWSVFYFNFGPSHQARHNEHCNNCLVTVDRHSDVKYSNEMGDYHIPIIECKKYTTCVCFRAKWADNDLSAHEQTQISVFTHRKQWFIIICHIIMMYPILTLPPRYYLHYSIFPTRKRSQLSLWQHARHP